jgi:hypothetical protein
MTIRSEAPLDCPQSLRINVCIEGLANRHDIETGPFRRKTRWNEMETTGEFRKVCRQDARSIDLSPWFACLESSEKVVIADLSPKA